MKFAIQNKHGHLIDPQPGEWVKPKKKGFRFICCDCGLVHIFEFAHIAHGSGRKIIFRVWRDEKATKRERKILQK